MSSKMTVKPRSMGQTAISISMAGSLLDAIDSRASNLGLNRSQYLAMLARNDIARGGELTISSAPVSSLADAIVADAGAVALTPPVAPVSYKSKPKAPRRSKAPRGHDS